MQEKKSSLVSKLKKWLAARQAQKEILSEDQVNLSNFLGIRPGVYLTCIYSFVLIVILFFVLVFPGLSKPGAVVIFETEPTGAALRVDGLYMGTSPGKIFVPKGVHQLEIILPDFEPQTIASDIPGRLFASIPFPLHYPLTVALECPAPVTVVRDAARDYADWTFGGEPTADWQIPLSLSEGIYRVGNNGNRAAIDDVLAAAARFAGTRAALRDLSRAKLINDNGGLSPSPVSLYRSAESVLRFLSNNPRSAEWLGGVLPLDVAVVITKSDWYKKNETVAAISIPDDSIEIDLRPEWLTLPRDKISLAGLSFTGVSGGNEKPFLICDTPVTVDAYKLFVESHGFWATESIEMLVENGLAAENYLHDDRPDKAKEGTENIQTAVSWFAAVDFCEWLTGRLPAIMSNYEVRLPRESEWEIVPGSENDLWEWCADPYAPVNSLHAKTNYIDWLGSMERSLRGFPVETRTSLPANFCSAFVSFRPVIAFKENP